MRFDDGEFDVTYNPAQTNPLELVAAVEGLKKGFTVTSK